MAACKSVPSLKILLLGIAFLFSTLNNHRRLWCTLDERIAIHEFANGFGTENLEALIVHKVFAKHKGHRRFSKRRVQYYSNSVATFSFDLILLAGDVEVNPGMSSISHEIKKQQRNPRVAHLNIRSIKNREHYILAKELVFENKFDIFTISESWLDNTVTNADVQISGYNIFRLDRLNKAGGSVCVFASDRFKIERLDDLSCISPSGLHQLWLKVQVRNCKSFIICSVYRPPTTSLNCFDEELSGTIISALSLNKDIYILGDLNCNAASQILINFCNRCHPGFKYRLNDRCRSIALFY